MRLAYVMSIPHNIHHHFFALSNPTPFSFQKVDRRLTRDIRRDILLLRGLNDYENEVEYTYEGIAELEREMSARCKKL